MVDNSTILKIVNSLKQTNQLHFGFMRLDPNLNLIIAVFLAKII